MIFEVSHRTAYRYGQPVSVSHHLLHLTPRRTDRQSCRDCAIEIAPAPSVRASDIDYFGNPTTFLTIQERHAELVLHALSVVEVQPPPSLPSPAALPPWEAIPEALPSSPASPEAIAASEFIYPSTHIPLLSELRDYAAASFPPGQSALAGLLDLTGRIHREFSYAPGSTHVGTSVAEAFAQRRGVCQDFAHIEIACLRALRIPARYVSGYLLTRPAAGSGQRLIGADASHAWLSAWLQGHGWIDLDPTNDTVPGVEHITLAYGRDYADVSPVSGIMYGGGAHAVEVSVDVVPIG